ncbi:phosphatidate phosphatase LPIN3 isoform X1 [Cydia splendana]|uniref:phosphatidate phosphatase LPIN3 isoform X1 n=1 Tax=Cydia splendana TaxID=1100963 RepID=UPI0028F4B9F1
MYSMNYIGKFIANFREFYNEINGATLTGAIDVVVVEQPDGSFTCSPFHVRFGKLGVLRSRFKVVDLELNGESLPIHMKLGESGEAFFVEEVGEDEAGWSAHLATSPIPAARFEQLYEPRRRNSLSAVEPDHGQASDYTKRRYTADGQSIQKPDVNKLRQAKKDAKPTSDHDNDALFEMDGLDGLDETPTNWGDSRMPKTFSATQLEAGSEAKQTVQMISAHNDFRPIEAAAILDDTKVNGNGKKKKKTRKVSSKKKHQRKSSTSSISSQSDRAGSEHRPSLPTAIPNATDINFFSDNEITAATLSEEMSNLKLTGDNRIPMALSDTAFEVHAASRNAGSRGGTPVQSDTEVELARTAKGDKSSQSWRWGELPEPPVRTECASSPTELGSSATPGSPASPGTPDTPGSPAEPLSSDEERAGRSGVFSGMFRFMSTREATEAAEGVYLDDLDRGQVDPDLYFPKHHIGRHRSGLTNTSHENTGPTEEEYESGNGPSLPQSPASLEPPQLDSDDDEKLLAKGQVGVYVREDQVSRALPFEEFCAEGGTLAAQGRLVVRLGDRWLSWRSAGPLLLSLLAYRRPLPSRVLESLEKSIEKEGSEPPATDAKPRGYSWWSWRRSNPGAEAKRTEPSKDEFKSSSYPETEYIGMQMKMESAEGIVAEEGLPDEKLETDVEEVNEPVDLIDPTQDQDPRDEGQTMLPENQPLDQAEHLEHAEPSSSDSEHEQAQRPSRRHSTFRKTLRLSSDQIKKLNLREGMNEMVFSVTTAYQGTTRCKCNVFRWRYDDKIVISDIDGTITKSDVLGHIFPLVGKDWAQSGVAQLFTKIKNNGYQLLYLSARAIGQARVTREYLRSIRQGETCLPDGPLLLNPTSLLRAFHREVIEKKPEEFKIQCLADIKALFPQGSNPFYAGYGNRVNDVCAYQAVGIPIVRIFTINYKGELKHELTQTFQSTYSHMSVLVDQVFPPSLCEPSDEFSQTVFWREPLPALDVPLPAPAPPKPAPKTN